MPLEKQTKPVRNYSLQAACATAEVTEMTDLGEPGYAPPPLPPENSTQQPAHPVQATRQKQKWNKFLFFRWVLVGMILPIAFGIVSSIAISRFSEPCPDFFCLFRDLENGMFAYFIGIFVALGIAVVRTRNSVDQMPRALPVVAGLVIPPLALVALFFLLFFSAGFF